MRIWIVVITAILLRAATPAAAVDFNLRDPALIGNGGATLHLVVGGVGATLTASPGGMLKLGPNGFGVQSVNDTNTLVDGAEYIRIAFDVDVTWNSMTISAQGMGGCSMAQFSGVGAPQGFVFCGSGTFSNGAGQVLGANTGMIALSAYDTNGFSLDSFSVTPAAPPASIHFTFATYRTTESIGFVRVLVSRDGNRSGEVQVDYATRAGSATANMDYVETSGTLTFGDNVVSAHFDVPIINDPDPEAIETFDVVLSNPSAGSVIDDPSVATVQIDGNDVPAGIFEFDPAAKEQDSDRRHYEVSEAAGEVRIKVIRHDGSTGRATVRYVTNGRSAIRDQDFVPVNDILVFEDGETEKFITVPIINDPDREEDETFEVRLDTPTGGAQLGPFLSDSATVVIHDDDTPVRLIIGQDARFTVLRANENAHSLSATVEVVGNAITLPAIGMVQVVCRTQPGSAQSDVDYSAVSESLSFPHARGASDSPHVFYNNEYLATVTIPIRDDEDLNGDRTLRFEIVSVTGEHAPIELPASSLELTIADDELPQGKLRFSSEVYDFNAVTDRAATITVERVGGATGEISVDYATDAPNDESAVPNLHYVPTSGTLVFPDGVKSQTFAVTLGNDPSQSTAQIGLTLQNPTGGAGLLMPSHAGLIIHSQGDFFSTLFALLCGPGTGMAMATVMSALVGVKWRRRARLTICHR